MVSKDLVQELEQVVLDKSAQSSDWATPSYLMSNSATPPMMSALLSAAETIETQTRRANGTS